MKKIFFPISILLAGLLAMAACSAPAPSSAAPDYSAEQVLDAVKAAYGDDYLPDAEMTEAELTDTFHLDLSAVEDYAAELSLISLHPDRVIVVKAKEGQGQAVADALEKGRETLLSEGFFYPMNMPKVNASKVVRNGDYVAFLMVGALDEGSGTEEEMAQFAEAEVQKGVDAFNKLFS